MGKKEENTLKNDKYYTKETENKIFGSAMSDKGATDFTINYVDF